VCLHPPVESPIGLSKIGIEILAHLICGYVSEHTHTRNTQHSLVSNTLYPVPQVELRHTWPWDLPLVGDTAALMVQGRPLNREGGCCVHTKEQEGGYQSLS
jgi:hypothetical protein